MDRDLLPEVTAFERRMGDLFRGLGLPLMTRERTLTPRPFLPATDVIAHGPDILVRIDLPGVDPGKDVTVAVEDDDLVVRGERQERKEVAEDDYYRMERFIGSFERRIAIPDTVDRTKIGAEYEHGVLQVTLPGAGKVVAPPQTRKIPVKVASPAKT